MVIIACLGGGGKSNGNPECIWLGDTLENSTAFVQASYPGYVKARRKACLH